MSDAIPDKPLILIVDDNPINIEALAASLVEKYEIRVAIDGSTCLTLAARILPDLILLDVMMPEMDGYETCRRLRGNPVLADCPVIFLSALDTVEDKVKAFQAGGNDYVTKPFQPAEVLARVATHTALYRVQRRLRERDEMLSRNLTELKDAHASLKEMSNQLLQAEKMASIGQLAAGVAHEINNPIGFVNSNLGTLQRYLGELFGMLDAYSQAENELTPATRATITGLKQTLDLGYLREDSVSLLAESLEGLQRVRHIVQDLKDFAHAGERERQIANLEAGLDSTLNVVWNELKYKAEVVKEYGGIPDIECIPSQLNQVFMNLLVNAAQAINDHGRITIRTGQEGQQVWVEIADTGHGIKPEHLDRIFDPFFTTKPVGKGTGLGLSLSYGIVSKHNGRIEVNSEEGKGTTFRIWLPMVQGEVQGTGQEESDAAASAGGQ